MIGRLRPCAALLFVAVLTVSACDSDNPTTPTPPPAPAPAPTPAPPPPPPPPAPAALDAITLSESSVVGQARPVATVRLTAAAPSANAPIFIESSHTDVAKVPANISVAAGQTTNAFSIDTGTVRNATTVTISARYEGVTKTVELTVLPPPLSAHFSVTSVSRGSDACAIVDVTGRIDCVFDASGSTGFVATYFWAFSIAGKDFKVNIPEGTSVFTPTTDCTNLSGGSINSDGYENMRVTLRLEDRQGNSTNTVERIVKLYPNGRCGY